MLIVCPSCASRYDIDPARLGPNGQRVRCVACRDTWFVLPPPDEAPRALQTVRDGETFSIDEQPAASPPRRPLRVAHEAEVTSPHARVGRIAVVAAAAIVLAVPAALAFRDRVVAAVPESAVLFSAARLPVNLAGLTIGDVTSTLGQEGNARVLVVEGRIGNVAGRAVPVPRLDLTVEGEKGEVLYRWTSKLPQAELAAGDVQPFRVRLASPPPAGRQVVVTVEKPGQNAAIAMH